MLLGMGDTMRVIENRKLRDILRILRPFFAIPFFAIGGIVFFGEKKHLFISLFVAVLSVLLFIAGFEKKEIGARRMVIVSVMVALGVIGRLIPFFKPITAITVITAMYLGGEAGFLVGALSALISNFYFGQGPWTPFQMLAFGLIGLFAGFISKTLRKSRPLLLIYGLLSGALYSFLMDVWNVLSYNDGFDIALYIAALITALPHTILYSVSNLVFLWFMAKPFGDKLNRIKIKYGI